MNKQTIYLTMKHNQEILIKEDKGYLCCIVGPTEPTVVGLRYIAPYWHATHYETGLDCTPRHSEGGWRSKEALLNCLRRIDFHAILSGSVLAKVCTARIKRYLGRKK